MWKKSWPFWAMGSRAQERYEALRAFMLVPRERRPRASAARFDLSRFERFGLLGLLNATRWARRGVPVGWVLSTWR